MAMECNKKPWRWGVVPRQAEPYHPLRGLAAPSPDGPSVSAAHRGRFTIEQSLQRDMTGLGLDHDEG